MSRKEDVEDEDGSEGDMKACGAVVCGVMLRALRSLMAVLVMFGAVSCTSLTAYFANDGDEVLKQAGAQSAAGEEMSELSAADTKPLITELNCEAVQSLVQEMVRSFPQDNTLKLNQRFSQVALEQFLLSLDPYRIAFTQEVLKPIRSKYARRLDDHLQQGECGFVQEIAQLWREQFLQSYEALKVLTEQHLEGNVEVSFGVRLQETYGLREFGQFAASAQDLGGPQKVYFHALIYQYSHYFSLKGSNERLRSVLKAHIDAMKSRALRLTVKEVYGVFLDAALKTLSRHHGYYPQREFALRYLPLKGGLSTVPIKVAREDGQWAVQEVEEGGAASQQPQVLAPQVPKLGVGDRIVGVKFHGMDDDFQVVAHLQESQLWRLFDGTEGSAVMLRVQKQDVGGGERTMALKTVRGEVSGRNHKVFARLLEPQENAASTAASTTTVGWLRVPSFYESSSRAQAAGAYGVVDESAEAVQKLIAQGMQVLILDLRGVREGFVQRAQEFAQLFLPTQNVFHLAHSNSTFSYYQDLPPSRLSQTFFDLPLLVLVDAGTAGMAEALVHGMKAYHRAVVVGDSATAGDSGWRPYMAMGQLEDGSYSYAPHLGGVQLTMGQFFGAQGEPLQGVGVSADVVIPTPMSSLAAVIRRENPSPYASLSRQGLKKKDRKVLQRGHFRDPSVLSLLVQQSAERLQTAEWAKDLRVFNQSWQQAFKRVMREEMEGDKGEGKQSFDDVKDVQSARYHGFLEQRDQLFAGSESWSSLEDPVLAEARRVAQSYVQELAERK